MYTNAVKASVLSLLLSVAAPVNAYWRMPCGGTLLEGRLDPIVSPNKVSGHTHVILGGNGFAPNMDYAATQASTCTSCSIQGDFSNYWVPKLYYQAKNGSFIDVPVSGGTVYYQQRVTAAPGHQYNKTQNAYPPDFRMTAGNPSRRTFDSSDLAQVAISHVCLGGSIPQGAPLPNGPCPDGLRAQIYFPSCWDGVNRDSPNHQSHMSYPTGQHFDSGVCPDSHPMPMISLFYEFIFGTIGFEWWTPEGQDQPFVYAMGDPTGYGFHGDFLNGWDFDTLQNGIDKFTTNDAGCADNVYCNNIFQKPAVSGNACSLPQLVDEEIYGALPALPGCNPVTMDPAPVANCAAPSTWGVVDSFIYTDETAEGWEYLGCGVDTYGNPALGSMPVEDSPTMTVPLCIQKCGSQGYSIAGLEYASQCFCGNTLPARASPTPGIVGDCNMPCAGNSSEYCGAGNRLSLYQKCTGTCQNAQFGPAGGAATAAPVVASTPAPAPSSASSASVGVGNAVSVPSTTAKPSSSASTTLTVLPVAATTSPAVETAQPTTAQSAVPSSTTLSNSNVSLPAGWVSDGCWLDTVNPRSLSGITYAWWGQPMTSSGCANYCDTEGYSMAGTENGGQCFCGNELVGSQAEPSTDCDVPCNGSASEICGGPGRLSMFKSSSASRRSRARHLEAHQRRAVRDKSGTFFRA